MTLIDTLQFDWKSSPWHIINSPYKREIFISLKGDLDYPGTAGIAKVTYESDKILRNKTYFSEDFKTLHGIDISKDGKEVYVSGRRDGKLHLFDSGSLQLIKSIPLGENYSYALAAGIKVK